MSISRDKEIPCPSCGKNQKVTIWSTINVTADPSLRECLFNGEINLFQCVNCELKDFLPVPLLYHDIWFKMTLVDTKVGVKYRRRRCQNGKDS